MRADHSYEHEELCAVYDTLRAVTVDSSGAEVPLICIRAAVADHTGHFIPIPNLRAIIQRAGYPIFRRRTPSGARMRCVNGIAFSRTAFPNSKSSDVAARPIQGE